jgi:hypothetical protein
MKTRTARCHCGQLEIRCTGEPRKVSLCHCLDCQRRTGSAFSVAVFYGRDRVRIESGFTNTFVRESASGFPVTFHFCGACGSNVFWEPQRLPDLIGVAVGAFADPRFPRPQQSVWTKDKHRWLSLPDDMATYKRNPPKRNPPKRNPPKRTAKR